MAALLIQWGKTLDKIVGDDSDSEVLDMNEGTKGDDAEGRKQQRQRNELVMLTRDAVGQTALVVEVLWLEVEPMGSAAVNGIDEA
jgi:hypothetical protein